MNQVPSPSPVSKKYAPPTWRRLLPLLGLVLLVVLIVIGLWPRAVPVETGTVTRGPLVVTVDEEGMTRVRNRYVVSAPVAGHLQRIDWKAGANVEAGMTVLATLEAGGADFLDARSQALAEARVRGAGAARDAALAQWERAKAAARVFANDFERLRRLFAQNVLSPQEFDAAQLRATTTQQDERAAEFAFKVAEYELQQAQAVLARGLPTSAGVVPQADGNDAARSLAPGSPGSQPLIITSPVNGLILRVLQESARVVPAGFPLLEVGDPADLEIRIEVLSRDGVAIRPGARVMLEQWGGSEPLNARVRHVEPSAFTKISALGVEEQRVYVVADFSDPPERRPALGDNYRVEARIVVWENANALRAPAGALFQRAGVWQAFVVEHGRTKLRIVEVGRTNGVHTEVVDGLADDASVVVYPGDKVTDGGRVAPLAISPRSL